MLLANITNPPCSPGVEKDFPSGIHLLRMPLPFKLDHINVYLLEDGDGCVLIDTGLAGKQSEQRWEEVLKSLEEAGRPLRRIILTHMHPDHLGMAQWLHDRTDATLYLTRDEWAVAHALWSPSAEDTVAWRHYIDHLGLPEDLFEKLQNNPDAYRKLVPRLPESVEFICDGDSFNIGGRRWDVIVGRGHSPEHACLWCAQESILISGDHILPDITPNIGVMHVGLTNPLNDYMLSLKAFEELRPKWVLPAHGRIMSGPISRTRELLEHHEQQLARLLNFCATPRSAFECTEYMFGAYRDMPRFLFAVREALAHLNYLVVNRDVRSWESTSHRLYQTSDISEPLAEIFNATEPHLEIFNV